MDTLGPYDPLCRFFAWWRHLCVSTGWWHTRALQETVVWSPAPFNPLKLSLKRVYPLKELGHRDKHFRMECREKFKGPFIKRAVYLIPEWISCLNESNERLKDIYRHLLAVLVSYLYRVSFHFFLKEKGIFFNLFFKGIVHPKRIV